MIVGGAVRGASVAVVALLALGAARAEAQAGPWERLVTRDGVRLDYGPTGAWRAKGRRVAAERARLRAAGRMDRLNAAVAEARITASEAAVSGVLRVPSVLIAFSNTDSTLLAETLHPARYDSVFYTAQPLAGRPYTIRTLYEEMSNGLLRVDGATLGWTRAANEQTYYLDACGTGPSTNAIDCSTGKARLRELFVSALTSLDGTVDFGQFDNDGQDGAPNSGDDDGIVDVVQFVQPVVGGECGGRGIWAHKFSLQGLGAGLGGIETNDPRPGGGFVRINPYHIVAGVGGVGCTASDTIMGIGTASHELGHGLGLPDLYDTGGTTEGVGEWDLMGSANFRSLYSPGHFSAWSKEQMGWVAVQELTQAGRYSLEPVIPGLTILLIRPPGANPRGEYFLLENKQSHGSDAYNMDSTTTNPVTGRQRFAKGGGLAVWHIDSTKIVTAGFPTFNSVNAGAPHGVSLIQADGLRDLEENKNRGDSADPYPGATGNTSLARATQPSLTKNYDGSFGGFGLSGIRQDAPDGAVSFQFTFGVVVRASDTLAMVTVNGQRHSLFHDAPDSGTTLNVSIDSSQTSLDGRARFRFVSWSNDSAITHSVVTTGDPDSLLAQLDADYRLQVLTAGSGAVSSSPTFNDLPNGEFLPGGTAVTLVATPPAGYIFDGWSGDTTARADTLRLSMQRPYTLTASFAPALVVAVATLPDAVMGAAYTPRQLVATGGTGSYQWQVLNGSLPGGMALLTDGKLAGTPEETGTFNAELRVRSGSQTGDLPVELTVVAPAVSLEAVLAQLVGADDPLTADEIRYFDLLGNGNGRLDVGDFAAWVEKTGVQATAQINAALARRAKGGP